jgi:hypothetical protein
VADDGRGLFRTFGSCDTSDAHARRMAKKRSTGKDMPEVPWRPIGPDESLRARFVGLVESRPIQWNPSFLWGKWLMLVASRLGHSAVLDDATLCFVAGCFAHQNRTAENIKVARRTYGRALSSLRSALASRSDSVVVSSETIAASKLLSAFEVSNHKNVE